MTFRKIVVPALLALVLPLSLQAQQAPQANMGKQAAQCFMLYTISEGLPGNKQYKAQFDQLEALMTRTMQDNKVSQKQFNAYADELMKNIGTPEKPNAAAIKTQVQTCNAFARARAQAYAASPAKP